MVGPEQPSSPASSRTVLPAPGLMLPQPDARQRLPSSGSSVGRLSTLTASVVLTGSLSRSSIRSWLLSVPELINLGVGRLML